MTMDWKNLVEQIENFAESSLSAEEKLEETVKFLKEEVDHYDWVGFYLKKGDSSLVLGPFRGEPTEHTEIDYGQGICGQVAESKENFLIQDVSAEDNYLACSPEVDSEIVIPVFADGEFLGEIDIDSHELSPFGEEDEEFLEEVGELLSDAIKDYVESEVSPN